jgi:hypothetical protein
MKRMGRYCKAYEVGKLAEFPGWAEKEGDGSAPGGEGEDAPERGERGFYYLQEDFTVTDGIFLGENVVFDDVTTEWIDFCKGTLDFRVPDYEEAKQ